MKILIEAHIKPGSEFQKEFLRDSLMLALEAWANYGERAHKKNELEYTFDVVE